MGLLLNLVILASIIVNLWQSVYASVFDGFIFNMLLKYCTSSESRISALNSTEIKIKCIILK